MRLTNLMMTNTALTNIRANQRRADSIARQGATGRQIVNPHENPLIASRHLRFENSRAQISQFQRNVDQANAWMTVTENAAESLQTNLSQIEERLHRMDVLETLNERQILANEIQQLVMRTIETMNTSFSGRYIFSGLRTDQPPFFTSDMPNLTLEDIEMIFTGNDVGKVTVFDRSPTEDPNNPGVYIFTEGRTLDIYRVRIAHNNAEEVRLNGNPVPDVPMLYGHRDYASMDPYGVYHDPATGELITLNRDNLLGANGEVEVMYNRTGFARNELNPKVFMPAVIPAQAGPPAVPAMPINMNNQNMEFEFSINTRIPVNLLAKDTFNPVMFADILGITNDILSLTPTTHTELINAGITSQVEREEFLRREAQMMETATNDWVNRLIGRIEGYTNQISRASTELGTRMTRVESIGERLEADAVIFEDLYTQNIGVDLPEMALRFSVAEVALLASMQIGMSHVMTLSLINFL
ncbi:MAG: hypothetical protein FWF50_06000 [Defluviitaleaceae bacterium]|nr:hypothetical protein [Defluviitaleaceae bacterium]